MPGVSWSVFNQAVCALRFLYRVTLQAPFAVDMIPYGKKPKALPAVLSRDEVAQLLACVPQPLERLLLQTVYACSLRASEVLGLRVTDIDSSRMVLGVRHGKLSRMFRSQYLVLLRQAHAAGQLTCTGSWPR